MNIKELTKELVAIPSYVDGSVNEKAVADYIYAYLKRKTKLIVTKEVVEDDRYNVIAYTPNCLTGDTTFTVDTLFINHIDTVEPKQGSLRDQFVGIEEEGRLYGLGSVDTKGNVAVLMKLAELVKDQACMFLFYVDEEYHFKGIRTFIDDYSTKLKVEKIISADGENLQIRNASRGVFEVDIVYTGKTGHASNQANGINVIHAFNRICYGLEKSLEQKGADNLGKSTLNVAYVYAGLNRGEKDTEKLLGRSGNNIPDYLEATLEFRMNTQVEGKYLLSLLKKLAKKENVTLASITVKHAMDAWYSPKDTLLFIEKALASNNVPIAYTNPGFSGYVDIGLLKEAFPSICCCIGAKGENRHGVNEYVEIASLITVLEVLKKVIQ
ncbi:MAG: M20/M25/M40 family metallo-hydrolase [Candidatus Levybacteria bacterium]|nr:M20/M25/M40 family metallo-hydrolase [Candidatus Levybacteria bacterium]